MPQAEVIFRAGQGAVVAALFAISGCGPDGDSAANDAQANWLDCRNGGPVAPRAFGRDAITYGALVCAGLRPDLRGVAPASGSCTDMGGDRIEVLQQDADTAFLCCILPNREAQSICLPTLPE